MAWAHLPRQKRRWGGLRVAAVSRSAWGNPSPCPLSVTPPAGVIAMAIQNKIPDHMGSMTVGAGMAEWVLLAVLVGHLVEVVFRPVKGVSALGVFGNEQHHLV